MKGVKYIGPVFDGSGYAKASRDNIMALYKLGVPLTVHPMSFETDRPYLGKDGEVIKGLVGKSIEYDTLILHSTPEFWSKYREADKRNIGYTVWETTKLHESWANLINNNVDACMVPCEWNVNVFKDSGVTVPMFCVPHVIDVTTVDVAEPYNMAGISPQTFVFYSINQFTERKNIVSTIKAFWSAFSSGEDVALVLKTYRNSYEESEKEVLRNFIRRLKAMCAVPEGRTFPPVYMILDMLSDEEINSLHKRGDCYISLDRGEGFGISSATAGAAGNPLIATGFGGITEYATIDNSYLVDYTEVTVSNMPWCVLPCNDVVLRNGRKQIENISLDDELLSQKGEYHKPKKVWSRTVEDELCLGVKAQGDREFTVTENHVIPVCRNGKRVELRAGEIKVGDYLIKEVNNGWAAMSELKVSDYVSVKDYIENGGFYYSKNGPSMTKKVVKNVIEMNEDFGRLIGYYLAEGSVSLEKRTLLFNFGYKEDISYVCEDLLKNVLGTELKVSRIDRDENAGQKIKRYESRVTVHSSLVSRLIVKLCGSFSHSKSIDRDFLAMFNKEFAVGLLKGIFEGDGHAQINGRNGIYLSLVNKNLLSIVKELLSKFGIYSSFRMDRNHHKKTIHGKAYNCRASWRIEVTGADKIALGGLLGYDTTVWKSKNSYRRYINNGEYFLLPITKIRKFVYSGKVHDIDMGESHPYYNLNGFMVHNSPWYNVDQFWAQPNEKQAVELMKYVYNNREEAMRVGAILKSDISKKLSYENIGNKIIEVIRGVE